MVGALSPNEITIGLATIVVGGVAAQWVARRFEFPAILLLLPAGFLAGATDLVDPDELFGDTLFPLVTLLVALLLFQAGLQLRVAELPRPARIPVIRLVTIGGAVTFFGVFLAVDAIFAVSTGTAFLIGAILVVSGPTVVGPLVRAVRPRPPIGAVLNWESTVLDPIGAALGAVVLNLVLASARGEVHPALQLFGRLGVGVAVGLVAAGLLVLALSRFMVTDDMEAAVSVLFAVAAFAVAEIAMSEAGLLAAVTLGIVVANQRVVPTARITGFGDTLEVLIIGVLFMMLGALVPLDALGEHALGIAALVTFLVLVVRPLAASLALFGTRLPRNDRFLVAAVDPRGIVAAATATQFAGALADDGLGEPLLLPVVFGVILGTGVVYGLSTRPLARMLGVVAPRANGVCLVGDAPWLADLAERLHHLGVPVLRLVTAPPGAALAEAREERIATISVHDSLERVERAVADAGLALAIVATPADEAVTLIEARLVEEVGRRNLLRPGDRRTPLPPDPRVEVLDRMGRAGRAGRTDAAPLGVPLVVRRADGSVHPARRRRRSSRAETVLVLVDAG